MTLTDRLPAAPEESRKNYDVKRNHHGIDREFIAWDGEGVRTQEPLIQKELPNGDTMYISKNLLRIQELRNGELRFIYEKYTQNEYAPEQQPYVLLANSKGDRIVSERGLSTINCFEFMLNTKKKHPNSIFVGFGLNYDINQILKDLPTPYLQRLHDTNNTFWRGYYIKWLPGKSLTVSHGNKKKKTQRSFIIYDVFGFFQMSFLEVCRKYLGDSPELKKIQEGKESRDAFKFSELDDFIIPYNDLELSMMVEIMDILRKEFKSIGIQPTQWHGPGAVANVALKKFSVQISRSIPNEVMDASQYAYAGGRFEQFWLGRYADTVYEYDINSAYPAGATHLPDLSNGVWENVKKFEPGSFGVWHIDYHSGQWQGLRPEPLFCRSQNGLISYPSEVQGWYWTPEAGLCPDYVSEGWVFRPNSNERPFSFIQDLYDKRRILKLQKDSAERALKLVLNSLYGKLAQTVGWSHLRGAPNWHQFEYAGYITSYTRAKIFEAVRLNPSKIIAIETDALFSSEPLNLPLSGNLGDWEEKTYTSITYLQSGFYYATLGAIDEEPVVCKYRGMDRDRKTKQPVGLPYRTVLDHLRNDTGYSNRPTPPLLSSSTRFVGLSMGLATKAVWRSWEKTDRWIALDQEAGKSKRSHVSEDCRACQNGHSLYEGLHPMFINGYSGPSYARHLPWRQHPDHLAPEMLKWLEMDPDERDYAEDMSRYQPQ